MKGKPQGCKETFILQCVLPKYKVSFWKHKDKSRRRQIRADTLTGMIIDVPDVFTDHQNICSLIYHNSIFDDLSKMIYVQFCNFTYSCCYPYIFEKKIIC